MSHLVSKYYTLDCIEFTQEERTIPENHKRLAAYSTNRPWGPLRLMDFFYNLVRMLMKVKVPNPTSKSKFSSQPQSPTLKIVIPKPHPMPTPPPLIPSPLLNTKEESSPQTNNPPPPQR